MAPPTTRPDPDALLAHVQAEETQRHQGKLKIFLGYAAGVGKTFAMLEAAHQRQREGVEVVIGYIETHKRVETEALVAGLELVPRKHIEYHGAALPEMDLDAVLARHPQLALVDEFAHTNAPGARHPKRYQDVEELLAAGIDVYTTLNIQHLESLNDIVAQITGVIVRETIPDTIIDSAAEIELVDLPPGELLQRLKEGKVYLPEQAAQALEKFFRQGNLTALREMALRRAAERVDNQMRAYMETRAIPGPWPAHERLLVLVGPSAFSERLVRTTRRLADELNAEWFALYIEAAGQAGRTPQQREQAARALQLAEELGAKALTLPGPTVAETALAYARQHNITKIVVGKSIRSHWQDVVYGSVMEQVLRRSGPIDVYVMSEEAQAPTGMAPNREWWPHRPYQRYGQSLVLVFAATLLGFLIDPFLSLQKGELVWHILMTGTRPVMVLRPPLLEPTNLVMLYLMAVVIAALNWGRGPAILVSLLSVLAFDFFFVTPYFTFAVSDTQYVLTFVSLMGVGLVMSTLAARAQEQATAAQRRELETAALYALSRDLAAAPELNVILQALFEHIAQTFQRQAVVLLPNAPAAAPLSVRATTLKQPLEESELAVAAWVYRHGEPAGRNTDTLPAARLRYLPLKTAHGVIGVLGVEGPTTAERHLSPEQRRLLHAFANQASLAVERAQLAEQARQMQVLQATEKLQTALLNSISHDLRTPLVSITGALSSLEEEGAQLDETARRKLVENARREATRLNNLVGNLLDMTRLEAEALKVKQEFCDVQEVIGAALEQMQEVAENREIVVAVPPDLPLVRMDFVLITRVLVNLLDNALKYSAPATPIEIQAHLASGHLEVQVADRGVGIAPADLPRVFDKFYRAQTYRAPQQPNNVSGTGLGLSICKGIVEAHGGFIGAENRPGGGCIITFALPLG